MGLSAKGAKYDSQGQATKERRPWVGSHSGPALKGRNRVFQEGLRATIEQRSDLLESSQVMTPFQGF
jgi:hypothetical protein